MLKQIIAGAVFVLSATVAHAQFVPTAESLSDLQPLKSQGVFQMDDSAMIVRLKFMTKPGDQFAVRTKVYARIRELFEQEGIKFAHREVTVRISDNGDGRAEPEDVKAAAGAALAATEQKPSTS